LAKKICLVSITLIFLFTTPAVAQLGLTLRAGASYGILLKPEISEWGLPEEKLTEGGFSFSGQVLYGVGRILSLGLEAGCLPIWKWDVHLEIVHLVNGSWEIDDAEDETICSAVPILAIIQLEAPLRLVFSYLQIAPGVYLLTQTTKLTVPDFPELDREVKDTETEFGIMFAAGVAIPLAPKLNVDVAGKLHLIFTEDESTITLNPGIGILLKF